LILNSFSQKNEKINVKKNQLCFIGMDIGGTKIATIITDIKGIKIYHKKIMVNEEIKKNLINVIFKLIGDSIKVAQDNGKKIAAIGVAIASVIDDDESTLLYSPSYRKWEGYDLKSAILKKFDYLTVIENDLNAAAWGEKCKGNGKSFSSFVMITIGTGVGGAYIYENKLHKNLTNSFYVGHVNLFPQNGLTCTYGMTGCLQTVISGTAIEKKARNMMKNGEYINFYRKNELDLNDITAKEVFKAATGGDKVAKKIVSEVAYYSGIAITNLIQLLGPQAIIIGGGVAQAGEMLSNPIKEVVKNRLLYKKQHICKILPASLGEDSSSIGICLMAIKAYKKSMN